MHPDEIITRLKLAPHPEGGHYREIFRDDPGNGGRGAVTSIYFLLAEGEVSRWHRVDAAEIWYHLAGDPLELRIEKDVLTLGKDIPAGEHPQAVVPKGAWQSARTLGGWTLVGCAVAPAFVFDGFEMAEPGFEP